jgi:hypothetical protein
MSEQAEVIKLLETIRAKRDLGIFAVEPKKSRKQREAEQSVAPDLATISATPIIVQSDLEEDKVIEIPATVSTVESSTNPARLNIPEKDLPAEVSQKPKIKSSLSHKNTAFDFHKILSTANDDFSLDRNRRVYLSKDVSNKLSLLKIAGNVKNVSSLVNAIIAQFLEENETAIGTALKDLTK